MGCVVSFVKLAFWHTLCCGPVAVVLPLIWALIHLLGFHPTRAVEILKMSWFGLFPIGKRLERTRDELPKDCPNRGCLLELYWAALWWPTALASFFVLLAVQIVAGIISGILSDIFDSKDIKLIGDYWDYFYWVSTLYIYYSLSILPLLRKYSNYYYYLSPVYGFGFIWIHCSTPRLDT